MVTQQNNGPVFNRVNLNMINWNLVENVEVISMGCIQIHFLSGRTIQITEKHEVEGLRDYIKMYPDLTNKDTLAQFARFAQSLRSNVERTGVSHSRIKTDIEE